MNLVCKPWVLYAFIYQKVSVIASCIHILHNAMTDTFYIGSKTATSGNGYFMGEFIGLEATIKSVKHFPKKPGNWAYFSFTTKDHKTLKQTATAFPMEACAACHKASAAADVVFTQYYPVLRAAKGY